MQKRKIEFSNGCYVLILLSHGGKVIEYWYDRNGELSRDNGLPAITRADGYESYWKRGYHD